MKVWTNNTFDCHWGEPEAAVIVANTSEEAAELLNNALERIDMARSATPEQMIQVDTQQPYVNFV